MPYKKKSKDPDKKSAKSAKSSTPYGKNEYRTISPMNKKRRSVAEIVASNDKKSK